MPSRGDIVASGFLTAAFVLMPSSGDIVAGGLLTAAFVAIVAAAEAWRRLGRPDPEWTRKLIHLCGGAVALCIPFVIRSSWVVLGMTVAMSGLFAIGKLTGTLRSLHGVSRKSRGTAYYPLVIYVLFCLTWGRPWKYVICVLVLAVADALAALIGTRYGRVHYELDGNRKSLEGSLAFLAAAFLAVVVPLLAWPDPAIPPLGNCLAAAVLVAVLVTAFEAVAQDGRDNLWVPLGTYVVLTKILRQSLTEIESQNAKLAGLSLAVGLAAWWTGSLNVGGTLVFVLAVYGCWALTSFDWVMPAMTAFGLYLAVRAMSRHRPRIRSRAVVHWLLLPWLFVAAANFAWLRGDLSQYRFLYGPYLAACTVVTALVVWRQILSGGSPGPSRRIGGVMAVALAAWAAVAVVPWLVQPQVPPTALFWTLGATIITFLPARVWGIPASTEEAVAGWRQRAWQWAWIAMAAGVVLAAQAVGVCPVWNPDLGGGSEVSDRSGYVDSTRTVPAEPSIVTRSPLRTVAIKPLMPTIVGMPISRATTAECERMLPRSMSSPEIAGKSGTHPGSVRSVARISPARRSSWAGSCTTLTVPVTTPGEQPMPRRWPSAATHGCGPVLRNRLR